VTAPCSIANVDNDQDKQSYSLLRRCVIFGETRIHVKLDIWLLVGFPQVNLFHNFKKIFQKLIQKDKTEQNCNTFYLQNTVRRMLLTVG